MLSKSERRGPTPGAQIIRIGSCGVFMVYHDKGTKRKYYQQLFRPYITRKAQTSKRSSESFVIGTLSIHRPCSYWIKTLNLRSISFAFQTHQTPRKKPSRTSQAFTFRSFAKILGNTLQVWFRPEGIQASQPGPGISDSPPLCWFEEILGCSGVFCRKAFGGFCGSGKMYMYTDIYI